MVAEAAPRGADRTTMKVTGPNRLRGTTAKRQGARTGAAGAAFALDGTTGARGPAALAGSQSLAAVDALLAVQEAPPATDSTSGQAKAVRRAEDMLDILDDIKLALLIGRVPRERLSKLLSAVQQQRGMVASPDLATVLDEIELRARVELAKFGRSPRD